MVSRLSQIAVLLRRMGWLGLVLLTRPVGAGPSNDSLIAPVPLMAIEGIQTVRLTGATVDSQEPVHLPPWEGVANRTLWYVWVAPADGTLLLSVDGSAAASAFVSAYDSLALFTGAGLGTATSRHPAFAAVLAGRVYLVAVGDQTGAPDEVTLSWRFLPIPDNDSWARRQRLPADGTPVAGWPALTRPDDFEAPLGGDNLVWYEWQAPAAGRAVAEFLPSFSDGRDVRLRVFREAGPSPGTEVYWPESGLPVASGELLRIGVKPGDAARGPFQFGVRLDTARLLVSPAHPVDTDPDIRLRVEVTDFDGEIREVVFHREGQRFAIDSTPPFEIGLGPMDVGRTDIRAALVRRDGGVRWVPGETLEIRPSNDAFSAAMLLEGEHSSATVDLATATAEPGEPNHAGGPASRSAWWSWTPPYSGVVRVLVAAADPASPSFSMRAAVYEGDSLETLRPVRASDANQFLCPVTGGVRYFIALDTADWWVTAFTLDLDLAPPLPNDAFALATPLTGEQIEIRAPSAAATSQPGEPVPNGAGIRSLWWTWTAPADGWVTLETGSGATRTTVEAYTGDSLQGLVRLNPAAGAGLLRLPVTQGTRLVLRAFREWLGEPWITFDLQFERPPANDRRADAIVIDRIPFRLEGNLRNATAEAGEPIHGTHPPTRTVWYRWTPSESGKVALEKLDESGGYEVAVYRDTTRVFWEGQWVFPGMGVDLGEFDAGTPWWIVVQSGPNGPGDLPFSLNLLSPPTNDALDSAVELSGREAHHQGHNLLATREPGEPDIDPMGSGQTVWYVWTAPETGLATVRVKGLAYPQVAAFTGNAVSELTPAGQVWSSLDGEGLRSVFSAVGGTRYWIGIDVGKQPPLPGSPGPGRRGRFEFALGISQLRLVAPTENVVLKEGSDLGVEAALPAGQEGALSGWQFRLDGSWHPEGISPLLTNPPMRHTFSNLSAGEYTVTVVGTGTNGAPHSSRPVAFRVAPLNDAMADATPLPPLPCRVNGLFSGTSEEPGEPLLDLQTATGSRWWTWVAPRSGRVSVELHGALGVFARTPSGHLEPVASLGHMGLLTSTGRFSVVAGQTYLLKVAPRRTPETPAEAVEAFRFTLAWEPEQDAFASPRILEGTTLHLSLDHTAATAEPGEPTTGIFSPQRSLWHAWTAPGDGWLLMRGGSRGVGPSVTLFTGSTLATLNAVDPVRPREWDPVWPIRFPVEGGQTYRISLDYFEGGPAVAVAEWDLLFVGPQDNDAFAGRLPVTGLPAALAGINLGATREALEPPRQIEPWQGKPHGPIGNTLWYSWTAPVSGHVLIRSVAGSSAVLADVFTGDRLDALRSLRPDAPLMGLPENVTFVAEAGQTYAISVGCLSGQEGAFHLEILGPPPNDAWTAATPVPPDASEIPVQLFLSTPDPTDPEPARDQFGSVWFQWTAPARGRVSLKLDSWDSSHNPSVWIGERPEDLRRVDSPDRRGRFRAEAGVTYLLFFHHDAAEDSGYLMPLVLDPPLPNDDFAEAIPLTGTEIEASGETRGATAEAGESVRSVWWRWTAPGNGRLWVTALAGEVPALFRGPGIGQLTRQTGLPDGSYRVRSGEALFLQAREGDDPQPVRFRLRFAEDPAVEWSNVGWGSDGVLHLTLRARPGQIIELERSTDLQNWFPKGRLWMLFPEESWVWPASDSDREFLRELNPTGP